MLVIEQGSKKKAATTPKPAPTAPPPPPKPKVSSAPVVVSEHGQGGGSSSSDTGKKPSEKQTQTGYATPAATQPKSTAPSGVLSEHGQGGGSTSGDTGKKPTETQTQTGYAVGTSKQSTSVPVAGAGHDQPGGSSPGDAGGKQTQEQTNRGRNVPNMPGAQTTTLQPKKAASNIPKPDVTIKATKETKPIVKTVPIGEWGVVKFESSASASVSFSSRDARGRSAQVEFDPNGLVSVSGGSRAFGNFAFTDRGTLSAEVSRFQDPGELLATDYGAKKTKNQLRVPVSTKADKTITVNLGNQWVNIEPKPTEYHIHAIVEDGHVGFEFSASRELEIKDSRGLPAKVEYEATTKMVLLETHAPGRPSRYPERIPVEEAIRIMAADGIAAATLEAIRPYIRSDEQGQGDEGGGGVDYVPDPVYVPDPIAVP